MATVHKLKSGSWRVQVRRKGQYISNVFRLKADADVWVRNTESRIDRGENISLGKPEAQVTLGDLIDLHIADFKKARKVPGRSKQYTLDSLKVRLGRLTLGELTAIADHQEPENGAGDHDLSIIEHQQHDQLGTSISEGSSGGGKGAASLPADRLPRGVPLPKPVAEGFAGGGLPSAREAAVEFLDWIWRHGLDSRAWKAADLLGLASEEFAPANDMMMPAENFFLCELKKLPGVSVEHDKPNRRAAKRNGRHPRATYYTFEHAYRSNVGDGELPAPLHGAA